MKKNQIRLLCLATVFCCMILLILYKTLLTSYIALIIAISAFVIYNGNYEKGTLDDLLKHTMKVRGRWD